MTLHIVRRRGCVLTPLSTPRRGGAHRIHTGTCGVAAPRNCPAHDRPPGGTVQSRSRHISRARRLRRGVKCAPEPQSYQSDMPPSIASGRHRAVCFPLNGYDVTYHLAASRAAFAAAIFKPRFFRKANAKRQCCLTIFSKPLQAPRFAPVPRYMRRSCAPMPRVPCRMPRGAAFRASP